MNLFVEITTKSDKTVILNRNYTKEEIEAVMLQTKTDQERIDEVLENGIYISESMKLKRKSGKIETGNSGLGSRDILEKDDIIFIFPEAEYAKRKARPNAWQKFLKILLG